MNRFDWRSMALAASFVAFGCAPAGGPSDGQSGLDSATGNGNGGGNGSGDGSGNGAGNGSGNGSSAGDDGGTPGNADGNGDGGSTTLPVGSVPPTATRGASVPYWEYEAEDAKTSGVVLAPSRAQGDIAAESSGRRAVRLEATGQSVTFTLAHPTSSIVVRYVIPDAPAGGGIDATLGLYVNGVRTKSLALTSRYAWVYGGESDSATNTPGSGAHHFYDEAHLLLDDLPAGATVALQKDAQDTAAYYVIDLVDFEQVAAPLPRPAGSLSLTDFGATPDDGSDDGPAIQKAIDAAKAQTKVLWIPKGTFESVKTPFVVSGVTIRGAGMWHSVLHGASAQFKVSGNGNVFSDFAVFGEVSARHDDLGENAFDGPAGTGSRLDDVWVEHQKVGWWVGKGAYVGVPTTKLTDGLVIHGMRVRDTYADGVNLCNGTSNSIVEQSSFRNTGDDSVAVWSPNFDGLADQSNVVRFNTVQNPWRANCFAVYGGIDNKIEDNTCADTVEYPGVMISSGFSAQPFGGTTSVQRNTLSRAGGSMYGQQHGALKLFSDQGPIPNVTVKDILIDSPTYAGIHVQGPQNISGVTFSNVQITTPGTVGILINSNAQGSAQADGLTVSGAATGLQNDAPNAWSFQRGAGDTGW